MATLKEKLAKDSYCGQVGSDLVKTVACSLNPIAAAGYS